MNNYREYMREAIKSPVDGTSSKDFGKWAILNKEQRMLIGRLLDEMDRFDEAFKKLWLDKQELQYRLDKAIDKLTTEQLYTNYTWGKSFYSKLFNDLLDILRGDNNENRPNN